MYGVLQDDGTSLSAAVDTSIISSVAAFHMPTLVSAGLFNFHFSKVVNLSAVGFCSLKTKLHIPLFFSAGAESQTPSERTVIPMKNQVQCDV